MVIYHSQGPFRINITFLNIWSYLEVWSMRNKDDFLIFTDEVFHTNRTSIVFSKAFATSSSKPTVGLPRPFSKLLKADWVIFAR